MSVNRKPPQIVFDRDMVATLPAKSVFLESDHLDIFRFLEELRELRRVVFHAFWPSGCPGILQVHANKLAEHFEVKRMVLFWQVVSKIGTQAARMIRLKPRHEAVEFLLLVENFTLEHSGAFVQEMRQAFAGLLQHPLYRPLRTSRPRRDLCHVKTLYSQVNERPVLFGKSGQRLFQGHLQQP